MQSLSTRPRAAAMYQRDDHWHRMESLRDKDGRGLPGYAFDFISVHKAAFQSATPYSLMAPLFLVNVEKRPQWEQETFTTKPEAVKRARQLAREHKTFIVDCT